MMSDDPLHQEPEKPLVYEPPDLEGRQHVAKVASDFRIREDECLADKLQNEEFEYHFGQNRSERWRGKIDIRKAKQIYLQEVENSGILSKDELNRLCSQDAALASDIDSQINDKLFKITVSKVRRKSEENAEELVSSGPLCKDDQFLAEEIENRMDQEKEIDVHRKAALEMQDEEFARYLEDRERKKYEDERKRRIQRKMEEQKATAERLKRESTKEARRDDEDALAAGVSRMKVKPDYRHERDEEEEDDEVQERNPGRNWSVKCEAAPSPVREKAKQELKDKEIARELQIKEVELEKKRAEEERDRRLALKLQKAEAEEYQRQKREREMRRAQSERRDDEHRHNSTSDGDSGDRRHRSGSNPSRSQSEKVHHQQQRDHREQPNNNRRSNRPPESDEPIYLKAVDSPSRGKYVDTENSSPRKRADHPIDREKVLRQQEEIYRKTQASNARKDSQKHDDRDRPRSTAKERRLVDDQMYVDTENSSPRKRADHPIDREKVLHQQEEIYRKTQPSNARKDSQKHDDRDRPRSTAKERRLVDDQMLLRQQAHDLSKSNNTQHMSSNNHKNNKQQRPRNTYDEDVDPDRRLPVRPVGHAPRRADNVYDEPEKNNDIDYTNIARNIDPTYRNTSSEPDYQTIGPPKTFKGHQIGMLDTDNPIAHVPPVPVIQNVKRTSRQEEKKKSKKWFK